MVVLSPNFTVLASLSALAVVSMLPATAEAAVLPNTPGRRGQAEGPFSPHRTSNAASSQRHSSGSSHSPATEGQDGATQSNGPIPALPLPGLSKRLQFGAEHEPSVMAAADKRWDPTDPLLQLGKIWIGSRSSPEARSPHGDVVVSGTNDHVHIGHHYDGQGTVEVKGDDEHVHLHRRVPSPEPHHHHHHGSDDDVVVSGDHDHVNIHQKRSPHSHHHDGDVVVSGDHDHVNVHSRRSPHHHHDHDKVVVSGDDDHVNIHHKRVPHSHRRSHRHHGQHRRQLTDPASGDPASSLSIPLLSKDRTVLVPALQRRALLGDDVVISDDHVIANTKRQYVSEFSEPEGVPGTIDIMSNVDGSPVGQRIASLTLSSTMGNDVLGNADPFMLNASGTNQTQIYMIVLPDEDSSTSGSPSNATSPSNTTSTYPSAPANSTSSGDTSQSFAPSAISELSEDPSSNSTAPVNSTAPSNSTSPSSSLPTQQYKRVALKIPLFDAESASMKAFCATFDPQPMAPSPLTVESCSDGAMSDDHKSQVFAYDPSTGAIQPMWYDGEGDGSNDDGDADSVDNNDGSDAGTSPADNSTTPANVTSTADVDSAVARIENLSDKLLNNDSTIRPPAPSLAANAHAFAAESYASAQNVTLMFTPMTPELTPHAASEERLAGSSSSSILSATSTSSFTSATDTNTSSGVVSTTITFSSTYASPTISSTAVDSSSDVVSSTVTFSPASAMETSSSSVATTTAPLSSSTSATASSTTVTATSSDASPTMSVHSLGVEVFDPDVTPSSSSSASATGSSNVPTTSSGASSASMNSITSSGTDSTATPAMTPYSTAPYEWMFKQSDVKSRRS